jgi:hypothetical protein
VGRRVVFIVSRHLRLSKLGGKDDDTRISSVETSSEAFRGGDIPPPTQLAFQKKKISEEEYIKTKKSPKAVER